MNREEMLELAEKAGFTTAYYSNNGEPIHKEIWGGAMETRNLERFVDLLMLKEYNERKED